MFLSLNHLINTDTLANMIPFKHQTRFFIGEPAIYRRAMFSINDHLNNYYHDHLNDYYHDQLNDYYHDQLNDYYHDHLNYYYHDHLKDYYDDHLNDYYHDQLNDYYHDHLNDYYHDHLNDYYHDHLNDYYHDHLNYYYHEHNLLPTLSNLSQEHNRNTKSIFGEVSWIHPTNPEPCNGRDVIFKIMRVSRRIVDFHV